jgi:hypothetical protein
MRCQGVPRPFLACGSLAWSQTNNEPEASPATQPANTSPSVERSDWMPGSYAPASSEKRNSFLRPLKNKGFQGGRKTKVGLDAIGKSTTLASNKSRAGIDLCVASGKKPHTASQDRL